MTNEIFKIFQPVLDKFSEDKTLLTSILKERGRELGDPEGCLARLDPLLDLFESKTKSQIKDAWHKDILTILLLLADQSPNFSEFLLGNPQYFSSIFEIGNLRNRKRPNHFESEISEFIQEGADVDQFKNQIRLFRRKETVRIGIRDFMHWGSIEEVCVELSDLADTISQKAFNFALEVYPAPPELPFNPDTGKPDVNLTLVAFGKLGGRELNFSSDIDVIFIYKEPPELFGQSVILAGIQEYYQKLAQLIINFLSDITDTGYVYRVDTRLRADGKMGELAKGLGSLESYYQTRGEAWEHQALIKARPIAGSKSVGKEFVPLAKNFAYKKYIDEMEINDTLRGVAAMREQYLSRHKADYTEWLNLKTGVGGIRDIEFIIQVIQTLYGGQYPEIQIQNSLWALDRIYQSGLLARDIYLLLNESYKLFRKIEHRIQMVGEFQRHQLPENRDEQVKFSQRLGYSSFVDFQKDMNDKRKKIDEVFKEIFSVKEYHAGLETILDGNSYSKENETVLVDYGFKDPKRVYDLLRRAMEDPKHPHLSPQIRRLSLKVIPRLLNQIKDYDNPDKVLLNWERCISQFPARNGLYRNFISNPELLKVLVQVIGESQYLADILASIPGGIDLILDPDFMGQQTDFSLLENRLNFLSQVEKDFPKSLLQLKYGEELKIGINFIIGNTDIESTYGDLSNLADFVVNKMADYCYQKSVEKHFDSGEIDLPYCILGLGKWGGRELNFCSDLDWIFIFDKPIDIKEDKIEELKYFLINHTLREFFDGVASLMINFLGDVSWGYPIYKVDARLRPFGKSAPGSISREGYEEYLEKHLALWERQALLKARVICGNLKLGDRVIDQVNLQRYSKGLTQEETDAIVRMRDRIVKEKGKAQPLKACPGGIITVEFLTQIFQLSHSEKLEELRTPSTFEALKLLEKNGLLPEENFSKGYSILLAISGFNRLTRGAVHENFPDKEESQNLLRQYLKRICDLQYSNNHVLKTEFNSLTDKFEEQFMMLSKDKTNS